MKVYKQLIPEHYCSETAVVIHYKKSEQIEYDILLATLQANESLEIMEVEDE